MSTWKIEYDKDDYTVYRCNESPNWAVAQRDIQRARVLLTSTDRIQCMHKCDTVELGMQWVDNWINKTTTGRF